MKIYTGISSRETPGEILSLFKKLATYLAKQSYVLRSGGAKGADIAFETGCDKANGKKEIYVPWRNFEGSNSTLIVSNNQSTKPYTIAQQFHPYWHNLSQGARKLQARNTHQILGYDLDNPVFSNFVICWTKSGRGQGGTGQAIRIAKHYNIPVFDAGGWSDMEEIKFRLREFLSNKTERSED